MTAADSRRQSAHADTNTDQRPSASLLVGCAKIRSRHWVVLIAIWVFAAAMPASWGSEGGALLSANDAAKLRLSEQEWRQVPRPRALYTGPFIVVQKPDVIDLDSVPIIEATTPMDLTVVFQPRNAPIDMTSLKVKTRRDFFSKSLTSFFKPYVHGTALEVEKAHFPTGKFLLDISIADQAGNITEETYRLDVRRR